MRVHAFGPADGPVVVMIHGLAMSWEHFMPAIELLTREHGCRVLAVVVAGHDPDASDDFTSVEDIAARIEDILERHGVHEAACLYGLSMGGGLAIRMLATGRLHYQSAVIDGGITPYRLPWVATRLILLGDFLSTELGRCVRPLLDVAFPPSHYPSWMVDEFHRSLGRMSAKSLWRAYDSTDNYSMPAVFPQLDTRIALLVRCFSVSCSLFVGL